MESCNKRALVIAGVFVMIALVALIAGIALTKTSHPEVKESGNGAVGSKKELGPVNPGLGAGLGTVDRCNLPKVVGTCRASIPSWYFDAQTEDCEQFIYGGCGGNRNNFESEEECLNACPPRRGRKCKSN